jgi:hypothetical protein
VPSGFPSPLAPMPAVPSTLCSCRVLNLHGCVLGYCRCAAPPPCVALVGAFNAVALLPVVLAMHYTGYEDLSTITFKVLGLIVVKGIFDNVISDMMWARAIMLTSPTIATVGTTSRYSC